ncbi:MAG: ECF transporter S component, partial [Clostridia bacterium]|nr:ECF transporter S component [Clostridia bacterium]
MIKQHFTTKNITRIAVFSALAFVLYAFLKFPLPTLFPGFLEMHFSELPALLASLMIGPIAGVIVIVIKTGLKLIFFPTSTMFVGEVSDILIGCVLVLTVSLIYRPKRTIKWAIIAFVIGVAVSTILSMLINRFVSIPVYSYMFGFDNIVKMVKAVLPAVTADTFYAYYIFLAVLPFNFIKLTICALLTFLLYKRLKK